MSQSAESDDPWVGRTIGGKLRLVERIGRGGLATIFRAEPLDGGEAVAVKLLTSLETAGEDTKVMRRRRFRREALAIAQLKHPNTVRLLDFGETEDDVPYLVLELVEGRSLLERLREDGPLEPHIVARVARRVAFALAEAHALGIVHRDVKPANIMLEHEPDGAITVKVVDFGAVRLDRAVHERMTEIGTTLGSAAYMSPEQARAEELSPASDLYSLGVTIYEALTGDVPFKGDFADMMAAHAFQEAPRLHIEDLDERRLAAWQELLDKLMAKKPEDRPGSAEQVAAALKLLYDKPRRGRRWSLFSSR